MQDKTKQVMQAVSFEILNVERDDAIPFDEYIDEKLEGHLYKKFYLYDTAHIKTHLLAKLFPKNHYITYLRELPKKKKLPKMVSVLRKLLTVNQYDSDNKPLRTALYNEVIGSQVLNYYGIGTALNVAVKESQFNHYVLSLDFISENEHFMSFDNLKCKFNIYTTSLQDDLEAINKCIIDKKIAEKYSQKEIQKLKEDYAYSFLIRKFVLRDYDSYHTNNGILFNEEQKTLQFINFDFEYCFERFSSIHSLTYKFNLDYCKKTFPKIYKKFVDKSKEFNLNLNTLLNNNEIAFYNKTHEEEIKMLKTNLNILNCYITTPEKKEEAKFEK